MTIEDVEKDANGSTGAMKGMIILYIILAMFLKGSKDKLWVMINAI